MIADVLGRYDGFFVVGGTSSVGLGTAQVPGVDELFETESGTRRSRTGVDISVFAPARDVATLDMYGSEKRGTGTSMATALMSGMLAAACSGLEQSYPGVYCDVIPPQLKFQLDGQGEYEPNFSYYDGPHPLYEAIRAVGEQDTVRHNGNRVWGYQSFGNSQRQTSRFLNKATW